MPCKYKALVAIAVAMTTQCPCCIEVHNKKTREAGATDAEIAEAATNPSRAPAHPPG